MNTNKKAIKITCLTLICIASLIMLALIPINIFCVNFPEWTTVLIGVLLCLGTAVYLMAFKTKLASKIILPAIIIILTLFCSLVPYAAPYWNSYTFKAYNGKIMNYDEVISFKTAEKDLKALKKYLLRIHPMFKNGLTDEVESAYSSALETLKNDDNITVNEFRKSIQSILHHMGDAHTTTYNSYPSDKYLRDYPIKKNDGYSVSSVNGKSVDEIKNDAKQYWCYETEELIALDFTSLASLDFYGLSAPYIYEWTNGASVISEVYSADDFIGRGEYNDIYKNYFGDASEKEQDFVYYTLDESRSLAILTLKQCVYNQTYIERVNNMFKEIKEKNISSVAVDLRGNGGGNSMVGNEFVKYLPIKEYSDAPSDWRWNFIDIHINGAFKNNQYKDLIFNGSVYVLTDTKSFSSAKDFAMLIQDNALGKVIGEASANSVNGYGDVSYFYLPETGIFVQISTKKWYRIDGNNASDYVTPDYPCPGADAIDELYGIIE